MAITRIAIKKAHFKTVASAIPRRNEDVLARMCRPVAYGGNQLPHLYTTGAVDELGAEVGDSVSAEVGDSVGAEVGVWVGAQVGDAVGAPTL